MIPYVEILGKYSLSPFAVVEPSQCWFELSYYEIGEFEIYCRASESNLKALKNGNYVKLPNKPYLWVIKSVEYTYSADGARMIDAKGFEAKWLLSTRIVMSPWTTTTSLKNSVSALVNLSMGLTANSARKVIGFEAVVPSGFDVAIESVQATRGLLSEFVFPLIQSYGIGSILLLSSGTYPLQFNLVKGRDLSDRIVFSQSMDNLISASYFESSENKKTYCQIVSTFNENNVSTDYVEQTEESPAKTGIDRIEMTIQSNLSTKYVDAQGVERETTPTSDLYKGWQRQEGKNALAEKRIDQEFQGEIDLQNSRYEFETDFFIGDLVMVRDEYFGYSAKARIVKYTIKQDENGYGEEAEYGE